MPTLEDFISSNMDYLYFIYGLAFVLTGITALELHRQNKKAPWLYLALFALSHGLFKWFEMVMVDLGDSPVLLIIRLVILACSFFALMEFGLRGTTWSDPSVVRGTLYPVVIAFLALGFLAGHIAGANAGCRYGFALTTGILALMAFWKASSQEEGRQRVWLRMTGCAILVYGLVAGLVVPKSSFLMASWLNDESFLAAVGVPVQAIRALCALTAMLGLWLYRLDKCEQHERWGRVQLVLAPTALSLMVLIGWFLTERREHNLGADLRESTTERVRDLARTINPERLKTLSFTEADRQNPAFQRVRQQMIAFGKFVGQRSIYSMALKDGTVYFGPENLDEKDSLASPPGTIYREVPAAVWDAFRSKEATSYGPYTDEYGTFVTAYAPVFDPGTSNVLVLVAADILANDWSATIKPRRLMPIACTLLVVLIVVGGIRAIQWRKGLPVEKQIAFRHFETAVVAGIGLVLTIGITLLTLETERRDRVLAFQRLEDSQADAFERELFTCRSSLSTLAEVIAGAKEDTGSNIAATVRALKKQSIAKAYKWIPAVLDNQRIDFEAAARVASGTSFAIWERDTSGARVRAESRSIYYPMFDLVPGTGSERSLGFDLGSNPQIYPALELACETGFPTATDAIKFIQDSAEQEFILAFQPVYGADRPVTCDGKHLRGFVMATIDPHSLDRLDGGLGADDALVSAHFIDLMATGRPRALAAYPQPAAGEDTLALTTLAGTVGEAFDVVPIFAFGRTYVVASHPTTEFFLQHPIRLTWLVGLAAILISTLVALFTGYLCHTRARLLKQVKERTTLLEQSEGRFGAIINAARDAIIVLEPDGAIALWSPGAAATFGWSGEEATGKSLLQLILPTRYHEEVEAVLLPFRESGQGAAIGATMELIGLHKSGQELPVELSLSALNINGRWGAVAILRDITERRESEEQLRRSEQKFRTLYNSTSDAVMLLDEHHFIDCNQATLAIFDCPSREEFCTKHPADVSPDIQPCGTPSMELANTRIATAITRGSYRFEWMHKKLGTQLSFPAEVLLTAIELDGRPVLQAVVRDITEHKRAEERLRVLADIVDTAPASITIHDLNGVFLYANQRTYDMHGLAKDEFAALNLRDLDTPESSRMIASRIHDLMESGEISFEAGHYRKDRSVVPLHVTAKNTIWNGRQVVLSIASDITELVQARAEVSKQNSLLNALINSSHEIVIFSLDGSCRYTAFNETHRQEMKKVWGVDIALGMNFLDLMTVPELREIARQSIDRALRGEAFSEIQHQHNMDVYYEFIWNPIRGKGDVVTGVTAFIRDITESYHVEDRIRKLATAVTQTDEGVVITDIGGTIEYVNPGFEKMTQYSAKEVIGKNPRILKSGKHDPAFYEAMWATLKSGKTWRGEMVNKKKDGSLYTEEMSITPVLDPSGKYGQYVSLKRDISEKLALKQMLSQSQKMEAVGRLAGGVAHDFNNLLTVISGYTAILSKKLKDNPQQKEQVDEIAKAAARATTLTRQLLAFSRRQISERTAVNLTSLTHDMTSMLKRLIGDVVDLKCTTSVEHALIDADSGQIEQVIMNLAVNARDAMPTGGTLSVDVSAAEFESEYVTSRFTLKPGRYIVLGVTDTGTGMTEDTLQRIFEPFFTTKELGKGTGLGLATVYGIVTECGGGIEIASQLGAGTTFRVYFPRSGSTQAASTEQQPAVVKSANSETILLVEGDLFMRSVVGRMIDQLGYKGIICESGEDALAHAQNPGANISLLIVDLVMPGMGGCEVAEQIRKIVPSIQILFMSGQLVKAVSDARLLQLNAGFIHKPYNKATLSQKIAELLNSPQKKEVTTT